MQDLSLEECLRQTLPFLSSQPEYLKELAKRVQLATFEVGDVILQEGQYIKVIPVLISGLVKVFKEDESGNEVLLYYIKPGESCIMSMFALIQDSKVSVKGIVEETTELLLIPSKEVLKITNNYPAWNRLMYDLFKTKYDELLEIIAVLTFSNKEKRVLDYLENEARIKGSKSLKLTHKQIASDLGSSREVISRILKKLEKQKMLSLRLGEVVLL